VIICGIEAQVGVWQTVKDLLDRDMEVYLREFLKIFLPPLKCCLGITSAITFKSNSGLTEQEALLDSVVDILEIY
jgi:hypothetical protein